MNRLSKIVMGLAAVQSVGAANISGVIDVTDICYQKDSTKINGNYSTTFDCTVDDGWSGNIDPILSIKTKDSLSSFSSSPTVDIDLTLDFNSNGVDTWNECSLSSTGSVSTETTSIGVCSGVYIGTSPFPSGFDTFPPMSCTGTSVSISETFKGSTGELLCQPATLSLSSVAGTLTDQHIVCTFNQCGETTPVEVSTPITCDDSHLDQCTTQEQCESIGKYWYSEKCNTTPEITSKPGNVTLPTGESKTSLSSFTGGLAISGGNRQPSATLNLADPVEVSGNIMIDQAHVGQTADLFVYAETTIPINPYTLYFMLKGKPVLEILMWDKKPKNLVAFKDNVILETEQQIFMYQGQFIYPGTLKVYFGYRLTDGTLVTSGESIDVTIN